MRISVPANLVRFADVAGAGRGRLSILIYHQVLPEPDPMRPEEVDAITFEWHMHLLAESFNVLPLEEAVDRLSRNELPRRAACITFDDGYTDNLTVATPILRRHGLTATFFVATGFLDGSRMWNDTIIESVRRAGGTTLDLRGIGLGSYPIGTAEERWLATMTVLRAVRHRPPVERAARVADIERLIGAELPNGFMMTPDMVRRLRESGMTIGAHTVTHPILAKLDAQDANREVREGRYRLEEILREPVRLFAYPNGRPGQDYRPEHVRMVREAGFAAAVSTSWGAAHPRSDVYQLPRFLPWDRSPARFAGRLVRNWFRRSAIAA